MRLSGELGAPWQKEEISDEMKEWRAHFVTGHFGLVLQGFDVLPVQDDLGVWCVPHDFNRRLAGSYQQRGHIILLKQRHDI